MAEWGRYRPHHRWGKGSGNGALPVAKIGEGKGVSRFVGAPGMGSRRGCSGDGEGAGALVRMTRVGGKRRWQRRPMQRWRGGAGKPGGRQVGSAEEKI
jgi:hypothetical protein